MPEIHGIPFKGAIFDLDGTLLDSMGVWKTVDDLFLASHGLGEDPEYTEALRVMSFQEAAAYTRERYSLRESPEEIIAAWNRIARDEYAHHISLKPKAREYLYHLKCKGVLIATATALAPELSEPALRHNGIHTFFDAHASVSEVARGKAFPDVYLLAAQKLGLPPEECIVFEDVLTGILGAKAAGMRTVGVYDAASAHEWEDICAQSELGIRSFAELLP